jgi:hypothetical protein
VYVDYEVPVAKFVDKKIEVPVGYDSVINEIALEISTNIYKHLEEMMSTKMTAMIDARLKEVVVPKIIEREVINIKNVDVPIDRPVFKDVPITNAIITDKQVTNAIITDKIVINAVIEDVEVKSAVFV